MTGTRAIGAQAGVDDEIENINDEVDEDEEISFKVPTNKNDPKVPENGSADNSKEKVTNKDDPEVPENGSADNSRGEYYFLIR